MGKANNLGDFMTDLADAIREKTGTTEPINPQDFSDTIKGITTGGGVVSMPPNNVNFRDYDGTILHSYSKDEFLALSAMPELPTRDGLTCQGWNCSYEDAVAYVTNYGRLEVGATYITDDGNTRLYISIKDEGRMNVPLYFVQKGVTIDWGDGSEPQTGIREDYKINVTHTYTRPGNYIITINVADGGYFRFGHETNNIAILGEGDNARVYKAMLTKVEVGKGVKTIGSYAFQYCYSLASVTIPQGVTSIGSQVFSYCYALTSVVFPQGVSIIQSSIFQYCYSLTSVVLSQDVNTIQASAFQYCYNLTSVTIPQGVTTIQDSAFRSCYSMVSVVLPQGVTNIYGYAFGSCYALLVCDLSALIAVPYVYGSSSFVGVPSDCKIIVPDALYDEWISATNWSSLASYIIKKTEWDAQNA